MKSGLLVALLLWQAAPGTEPATANPQYFRYQRSISVTKDAEHSCAILDPSIFPHAAPSLKDLRLYSNDHEVPYAITLSEPQQVESETAKVRNLALRGRNIVFDLEMPNRPYTEITFELAGHDFVATVSVSGTRDPNDSNLTRLGEFTLFDLTSQHLSRNMTIHLQETSLPYLHVELAVSPTSGGRSFTPKPEMVEGITVPPSREAQSLYTTAATTTNITQRGHQSVASFELPERVPVERISFDLASGFKTNFSHDVRVSSRPVGASEATSENLASTILRVHLMQAGHEIRQEQLSVPAILGSNLQSAATVEIAVENGNDAPLPIKAIRLEMRQRKICFSDSAGQSLVLFYGDSALSAARYDYARLLSPSGAISEAQLGPEMLNPAYHPRPDAEPATDKNQRLLWIGVLAAVGIVAMVAIRMSKRVHH